MLDTKKRIILVIVLLIVTAILIITSSKKEELSEKHAEVFAQQFIDRHFKGCLKKKKYSLDNPTPSQVAECQAVAKQDWEEILILNNKE